MSKKKTVAIQVVGAFFALATLVAAITIGLSACGAKHDTTPPGSAGLVPWISANSPGNGDISVTWGAAANSVSYDIYREIVNEPGMPDIGMANRIERTDQMSFSDNVDPSAHYGVYYWVVGVDSYGNECLDYYGVLNSVVGLPLINGTATSGYTTVR